MTNTTENQAVGSWILRTNALSIEIDDTHIVSDVTIEIGRGEVVGLAGPSGAGKSLTLWSLVGLLPEGARVSGTFDIYNAEGELNHIQSRAGARNLSGRVIAVIPQNPFTSLNPVVRCGVQIGEMLLNTGLDHVGIRDKVLHTLRRLGFIDPERIFDAYPFELSGGQLQRVVIAMATIGEPQVVLADEPTTALDVRVQHEVLSLLANWVHEHRKGMLIVSHDHRVLRAVCDKVYSIGSGRVRLNTPETASPGIETGSGTDHVQSRDLCLVRDLSVVFHRRGGSPVPALTGVSFSIKEGEMLGVVGSTGSGKTTIAKVLTGLVPYQAGALEFHGTTLNFELNPELRRSVQMIFQDPYSALYPHWTIQQYLREVIRHYHLVAKADEWQSMQDVMTQVGLPAEYLVRYPTRLSGGERQRVQIARALLMKPELLICDEMTSGLDAALQEQILETLMHVHRHYGMAMLYISHDLGIVRRFADRVLILDQGRIVEEGSTKRIFEAPEHEVTKELVALSHS